jgi:asparagine N-glycosylation enzyme membrane subunit Stt3
VAVDYLGDHLDQVPSVVVARLGRGLSVWQVDAMATLNQGEGRERLASWIGVVQFWTLVPLAAYGLVAWPVAQRRWPMLALILMSVLTIAALYGIPRFRIAAEVAIVVCGAIGLVSLVRRQGTGPAGLSCPAIGAR